ncbi:MAG: nitrite/sulfite reductase [Deltaproteobacteria bacterium]|nr:nitrite/sulfite reductase [Deltaproteobacteria bacterium]
MDLDSDLDLDGAAAAYDNDYSKLSDVDEFIARTEDYAAGRLPADAYRAYRLTRGVYGQRQDDVYMLRIKMPGGIVLPRQLRTVAEVVDRAPERLGHITTRENIQIHHFPLPEVAGWMHKLAQAGLTMTEACGNAVRNITQDPYAGLAPDEAFDTTPYLQEIVRFFLRNPRAQGLPRKFKIALSASAADRGYAAIHDIGLVAVRGEDGKPAFRMMVGGGLASMPRSGLVVHEAWPARDILTPMLAVIDFFQEHGNRKIRSKARIKHVLRKMGDGAFAAKYQEYLQNVLKDPPPALDLHVPMWPQREAWHYARPTDDLARASGFASWAATAVRETRVPGRVFVTVRIDRGGEVSGDHLRALADLTERYGEGKLHFTPQQNAVLRAVKVEDLPALWRALRAAGLGQAGAGTMADITSCPGISTCNLGITFSRNLADALIEIVGARPDTDLNVKISGCHNACGQHHIGTIGFYGALRRVGGRPAPHYRVLVGGGVDPSGAAFGRDLGLIPARRAPEAVRRLLAWADAHKAADQSAGQLLRTAEVDLLQPVIADLLDLDEARATELEFWDIGATEPFLGEAAREGECAA